MQNTWRTPAAALLVLLILVAVRPADAAPAAAAVQQQLARQTGQLRASGGLYVQGLALASGQLQPREVSADVV